MIDHLTIKDFIGILYDAVRHYAIVRDDDGNQIKCLRPQTFLPVLDFNDISPEGGNLTECEKYKKFFFSRDWEESGFNNSKMTYSYPAVIIQWENYIIKELFGEKSQDNKGCNEIHTFTIGVIDQYIKEKCTGKDCHGCNGRNPFEIFLDCKEILNNILTYVKAIKRIQLIKLDNTTTKVWMTSEHADLLKTNETITDYSIDSISTKEYIRNISNENTVNKGIPFYSLTFRNLYGISIDLDLKLNECSTITGKFDFDKSTPKYLKDSCC